MAEAKTEEAVEAMLYEAQRESPAKEAAESSSLVETDAEWMTHSQFAQVVFPDVSESYVNSDDLECTFTHSDLVELSQGDRVALYRVPQISPHEFVSFQWITEGSPKVVFKADDLPKQDDFYQYQYLRADHTVLGASVPFRLMSKPKEGEAKLEEAASTISTLNTSMATCRDDELSSSEEDNVREEDDNKRTDSSSDYCVVSDQEEGEFSVIRDKKTVTADKYKKERDELQRQYSSLLSDSERLSDELHEKTESFMVLSESHAQTKADLGALVAVKVDMEQKLHRALEELEKMTNKAEAAQVAEKSWQDRITKLEAENCRLAAAQEEAQSMVLALANSKALAVEEIRKRVLERDQCAAKMAQLEQALQANERCRGEETRQHQAFVQKSETALMASKQSESLLNNEVLHLKMIIDDLKSENESLRGEKDELENEANIMRVERQAFENDNIDLRAEIVALEDEREELQHGRVLLEEENTQLKREKTELNHQLENLAKELEEAHTQKNGAAVETVIETQSEVSEHGHTHGLVGVEKMLEELRSELRMSEMNHVSEINAVKQEIEMIKSASYGSSAPSSTVNLDSFVIENALSKSSAESEEESRERHGSGDVVIDMEGSMTAHKDSASEAGESERAADEDTKFEKPKEKTSRSVKSSKSISFQEAVSFIRQLRATDESICDQVMRVLERYKIQGMSKRASGDEILKLLKDHPDLISQFRQFYTSDSDDEDEEVEVEKVEDQDRDDRDDADDDHNSDDNDNSDENNDSSDDDTDEDNDSEEDEKEADNDSDSQDEDAEDKEDLEELAEWAKAPVIKQDSASANQYALTDDGRPVPVEVIIKKSDAKAVAAASYETSVPASVAASTGAIPKGPTRDVVAATVAGTYVTQATSGIADPVAAAEEGRLLECPVCAETFQADKVKELEMHVESHLCASRACPVCGETYDRNKQEAFEQHVQEHFLNEDYSMPNAEDASTAKEEQQRQQNERQQQPAQQQQQQGRSNFLGLDLNHLTNTISNWTLEID